MPRCSLQPSSEACSFLDGGQIPYGFLDLQFPSPYTGWYGFPHRDAAMAAHQKAQSRAPVLKHSASWKQTKNLQGPGSAVSTRTDYQYIVHTDHGCSPFPRNIAESAYSAFIFTTVIIGFSIVRFFFLFLPRMSIYICLVISLF